VLSEELCEIWELGTVYNSIIFTCQRRIMHYGELFLHGTRIVIPKVLRDNVVRRAHEGHQGVIKTKYLLQSKVWWPGMDKDVDSLWVCHGCQVASNCDQPNLTSCVLPPTAPSQDCSADLLGPHPQEKAF